MVEQRFCCNHVNDLLMYHANSVNDDGKSLKIITTDCNVIEKRPNEITPAEMSALQQVANSGSPSQSVLLSGTRLSQSSGPYIGGYVNQFNYSDVTAQFIGQNHRMISSPSLRAANVQRLSVDDDLVTLIFQDDTLLMKPKSCLDASAQQLLSSAESELAKAKAKWELDSQTQGIRLNYDVPQIESDEQTKRYQAQAEENARNYQAEMQRYAQQVRADAQEYARQIRNYYSRY